MPDKDKKPAHSKLADVERLRHIRYMTKGEGAKRPRPAPPRPTVDQLRSKVAAVGKVAPKRPKKKSKKRGRR